MNTTQVKVADVVPIGAAIAQVSDVRLDRRGPVAHLRLSGDLDMVTSPELDRSLEGHAGVVLDLERVTFMDSRGLRSLLEAHERASRSGRTFAIIKAPPSVRRLLEITRTTYLLGTDPRLGLGGVTPGKKTA